MTKEKKQSKSESIDAKEEREFKEKVAELKKGKSKDELLAIVSKQPENNDLVNFLAARKALDELKVSYSKSFA